MLTEKRRQTLIRQLQRKLDKFNALPVFIRANYKRDCDYKRAVTVRRHVMARASKDLEYYKALGIQPD